MLHALKTRKCPDLRFVLPLLVAILFILLGPQMDVDMRYPFFNDAALVYGVAAIITGDLARRTAIATFREPEEH